MDCVFVLSWNDTQMLTLCVSVMFIRVGFTLQWMFVNPMCGNGNKPKPELHRGL